MAAQLDQFQELLKTVWPLSAYHWLTRLLRSMTDSSQLKSLFRARSEARGVARAVQRERPSAELQQRPQQLPPRVPEHTLVAEAAEVPVAEPAKRQRVTGPLPAGFFDRAPKTVEQAHMQKAEGGVREDASALLHEFKAAVAEDLEAVAHRERLEQVRKRSPCGSLRNWLDCPGCRRSLKS